MLSFPCSRHEPRRPGYLHLRGPPHPVPFTTCNEISTVNRSHISVSCVDPRVVISHSLHYHISLEATVAWFSRRARALFVQELASTQPDLFAPAAFLIPSGFPRTCSSKLRPLIGSRTFALLPTASSSRLVKALRQFLRLCTLEPCPVNGCAHHVRRKLQANVPHGNSF